MTKINCKNYRATGLYVGFAKPKGTAAVCHECNGTGYKEIEISPFYGRKMREDISRVFVDGGLWFGRDKNSMKQTISIEEFYEKIK